jgi:hypothetical protein
MNNNEKDGAAIFMAILGLLVVIGITWGLLMIGFLAGKWWGNPQPPATATSTINNYIFVKVRGTSTEYDICMMHDFGDCMNQIIYGATSSASEYGTYNYLPTSTNAQSERLP